MGTMGDLRKLKKEAKAARKASGKRGGLRGMSDAISEGAEMVESAKAQAELLQTGLVAAATVKTVAQTGRLVNYQPEVAFVLDVTIEGQPPYEVNHAELVPQPMLGMIQPGESLVVRVDLTDHARLAIDWVATQTART